jgi:hypothetical protein
MALAIAVLIGFLALAIDVGLLAYQKGAVQMRLMPLVWPELRIAR